MVPDDDGGGEAMKRILQTAAGVLLALLLWAILWTLGGALILGAALMVVAVSQSAVLADDNLVALLPSLCETTPNDRATLLLTVEARRSAACHVDPTIQACRTATAVVTDTIALVRRFESGTAAITTMCAEKARQDALARKAERARRDAVARAAKAEQIRKERWNECHAWIGSAATLPAAEICQRIYHTLTFNSVGERDATIEACIVKAKVCQSVLGQVAH